MDVEFLRIYCLQKPGAEEALPFGPDTLVFKVANKIFALTGLDRFPPAVNLKCHPDNVETLRLEFPGEVLPGYHMNKKHWNTVLLESSIPDALLMSWIDDSYNLIVKSLSAKEREVWGL